MEVLSYILRIATSNLQALKRSQDKKEIAAHVFIINWILAYVLAYVTLDEVIIDTRDTEEWSRSSSCEKRIWCIYKNLICIFHLKFIL